jgi:hypothetical protein
MDAERDVVDRSDDVSSAGVTLADVLDIEQPGRRRGHDGLAGPEA